MTRPKNYAAIEYEAQLQEAVTAVRNKQYSCHTASIVFNISHSILYDRIKENIKSPNLAHEAD